MHTNQFYSFRFSTKLNNHNLQFNTICFGIELPLLHTGKKGEMNGKKKQRTTIWFKIHRHRIYSNFGIDSTSFDTTIAWLTIGHSTFFFSFLTFSSNLSFASLCFFALTSSDFRNRLIFFFVSSFQLKFVVFNLTVYKIL